MKIICIKCKGRAELSDDFNRVKCSSCGLDVSYAQYLDLNVQRTILGDSVNESRF